MYLSTTPQTPDKSKIRQATHPGFWQHCTVGSATLITISTYIAIARILDPQSFGSYLFVQWLATLVATTTGAGMSILTSQQIATLQSRKSPQMIAGIFYFLWHRQHRRIVFYCLSYLLLALFLPLFLHWYGFVQFCWQAFPHSHWY